MPLNLSGINEAINPQREAIRLELMRRNTLDQKIQGKLTRVWMPENADAEYKDLFKKASSPWLEFTAAAIAQGIRVDGFTDTNLWQTAWQGTGMASRQDGVTREAVRQGQSFILVMPTDDPDSVAIRPLSALQTFAYYDDPWQVRPTWVISRLLTNIVPGMPNFWNTRWVFVDNQALYRMTGNPSSGTAQITEVVEHGLGYCPVARIANTLDPFNEPRSSVASAIPVYQRIVDATFALEMAQRYSSFPQKWMSGGVPGDVRASVDSLMHSDDPTTQFGAFPAGSLSDVASAVDTHIKHLAAITQVPPHYLLGAVVNMSAEGIAAAESGFFRNVAQRQDAMREGYEDMFAIAGDILGTPTSNTDELHYEDVSARSLAQIADAVQKLASVNMPLARLFQMLPGFSQTDAEQAANAATAIGQANAKEAAAIVAARAGDKGIAAPAFPEDARFTPTDATP